MTMQNLHLDVRNQDEDEKERHGAGGILPDNGASAVQKLGRKAACVDIVGFNFPSVGMHARRKNRSEERQAEWPSSLAYDMQQSDVESGIGVNLGRSMFTSTNDVDSVGIAEVLRLEHRGICTVEKDDVGLFTNLKAIYLNDNRICDISPLGLLTGLRELHISCNRVDTLPPLSAGLFYQLQVLDVSFNFLSPDALLSCTSDWSKLPSLRQVDLSGNNLSLLPALLGPFPALTSLRLDQNAMTGACLTTLMSLPHLEYLSLCSNRIRSIPASVSRADAFRALKRLDLSDNRIWQRADLRRLEAMCASAVIVIIGNPIAHQQKKIQARWQHHQVPPFLNTAHCLQTEFLAPHGPQAPSSDKSCQIGAGNSICLISDAPYTQKPTLGQLLSQSAINTAQEPARALSTAVHVDHARLGNFFDHLHEEIDKWRYPALVKEKPSERDESGPSEGSTAVSTASLSAGHCSKGLDQSAHSEATAVANIEAELSNDPTISIATKLGMDPSYLLRNIALNGSDARGAFSRLRFALAHPATQVCGRDQRRPHHQASTTAATMKQRRQAVIPCSVAPIPSSPHLQQVLLIVTHDDTGAFGLLAYSLTEQMHDYTQVESIEKVLCDMKVQLMTVQQQVGQYLPVALLRREETGSLQ